MNKKYIILLLITLFTINACGGSTTTNNDDEDNNTTTSLTRTFSFTLPLFATTNGWNQTATNATVLDSSDDQILYTFRVLLGDVSDMSAGTVSPQWPYPDVSYDDFSVAIYATGSETQDVLLKTYEDDEGSAGADITMVDEDTVTLPARSGSIRSPGPQSTDGDGHTILYDAANNLSYDIWQATTKLSDGASLGGGQTGTSVLWAGAVEVFDITGAGVNPDGVSSARASGVPLLAGMIMPEDVAADSIDHALGVSIPGPRNTAADPFEPSSDDYFYPVSTTETDFYSTHDDALASGQRIRLKSTIVDSEGENIDEEDLAPITQMFLTAMRTYGAIVVDNAGGFSFYAEDYHTANLDLTDAEVNAMIGASAEASLDSSKTDWQIIMAKLNEELEDIPFAYGPDMEGDDPDAATITTANYEVVTPATNPD
ncbi:MAG: hypothetical protein ABII18_03550 [bacterium]